MLRGVAAQEWQPGAAPGRFPFTPYPRGWFAVAWGPDLGPGDVRAVRALGQDLVVFRGMSGSVAVLDAHCPHLGAHLGFGGQVEGDWLRCPFHAWAFDGDGRCRDVPGQPQPAAASCGTWPTREVNGMILAWHDPQHGEPEWEVEPVEEAGWSPFVLDASCQWLVRTHVQEIVENSVDAAHLPVVHGMGQPEPVVRPAFDGPSFEITLHTVGDGAPIGMDGPVRNTTVARIWGLGLLQVVTYFEPLLPMQQRSLIHITPVDQEHVMVRAPLSMRGADGPVVDETLLKAWTDGFADGFERDIAVWEHKVFRPLPRLSRSDGPVMHFRRWAAQFTG